MGEYEPSQVQVQILESAGDVMKLWISLSREVLEQLRENGTAYVSTDDGPIRLVRGPQAEPLGEVVEAYINLR